MVKFVQSKGDFDKLIQESGDKLIVVDFTASWCGPCRNIAPAFECMEKEHADVIFFKVDVDESEEIVGECQISSMPTFVFFKSGKEIGRFSGANVEKLKEMVAKNK